MDKNQFLVGQLTSWIAKYGIPCLTIKEGYVKSGDAAAQGIVYDEQLFFMTSDSRLGHSSTMVYTNKKELVAVSLDEVSDTFLSITKAIGELYGVRYKEIRKLNTNKYLYLF